MCTYTLDEDDDDDDGAGAGQRGGLIRLESLAVLYRSFSSSSCLVNQDRAFVFLRCSLGLSLQNVRCGVADQYAFQPYRSRTGPPKHGLRLKPPAPDGTRTRATRTIPSRTDLPCP